MKNHTVIIFFSSIFLGAVGAWFMANYGPKIGFVDRPNERSSHQSSTPKGGGIGILAGFVMASLVLNIPAGFWIPAALISMMSLIGDHLHLSPRLRLFLQFSFTIIFLLNPSTNDYGNKAGYLMIIPLSIFIVGTANFYNFMDGIDGIAGLAGFVGFGLLAFYSFSLGNNPTVLTLSICMALGCLGFLPFNIPKARVFMGDVGSILLGFVFAAVVILLSKSLLDFVCLASFLFPFYVDELTTEIVRLKDGEKLWRPHRRHIYQILANEYSISHWKVSLGYGIAQLWVGISVILLAKQGLTGALLIIFLYFSIFVIVFNKIRNRLGSAPA